MIRFSATVVSAAQASARSRLNDFREAHFHNRALRDAVFEAITGRPDPSGPAQDSGEQQPGMFDGPATTATQAPAIAAVGRKRRRQDDVDVEEDASASPPQQTQEQQEAADAGPFMLVLNPEWAQRFGQRIKKLEERDKQAAKKAKRAKRGAIKKANAALALALAIDAHEPDDGGNGDVPNR